jgi:diaminopimelate epimerase
MEMYNADGSRAEMCGNGIRCVGKFVYDNGLTDHTQITVESFGKVKYLNLTVEDGKVTRVRVNMGAPELLAEKVPVISEHETAVDEEIFVDGKNYHMTCVSMGNPHAVVFMDDVAKLQIEQIGPSFENHERFPNRTNTEFVKVIDDSHVEMRVWERGTGETLACGTGCCATAVACVLNKKTGNHVFVKVLGGEIEVEWDRDENLIYMTGPAETVFAGEYPWAE